MYVLGAEFPPRDTNADVPMWNLECEKYCGLSKEQYIRTYWCFATQMNSHKYICALVEKWPKSFTNSENMCCVINADVCRQIYADNKSVVQVTITVFD